MREPRLTSRRLMILVALLLGETASSSRRALAEDQTQVAVLAAIEKSGGKIERDHIFGRYHVDFQGSALSDAGMTVLKELKGLESVNLRGTPVGDAGLAQLDGRKGLLWLDLRSTKVRDAGLAHLATMPDLRSVDLRDTQVSDAGLAHLQNLTRIVNLDLRGTRLSATALAKLRQTLPRAEIRGSDQIPYFPEGVFDKEDKEEDDSEAQDISRYLRRMGETSLWKRDKEEREDSIFRLVWIPSFDDPVSVRIVHSGGSFTLHAVRIDGTSINRPGKVRVKKQVKLTQAEWTDLQDYLERARFWKMPTIVDREFFSTDGDWLICEGVANGKYHVVNRLNVPDPNYEKLCWYMLSLSGLDLKKTWEEYHEDEPEK
jgi:hypothetical protein